MKKILFAIMCICIIAMPLTYADKTIETKENKTSFNWGPVIEAFCDADYSAFTHNETIFVSVGLYYFVLAIGRHSISCGISATIELQNGSFVNFTEEYYDDIFLFKPIARKGIFRNIENFKSGSWLVGLAVDNNILDKATFNISF